MEVKEVLRLNPTKIRKADWAAFWDYSHLTTRRTPYKNNNEISLKDISYAIIGSTLYISGKQCYWDRPGEPINEWSLNFSRIFETTQAFIDTHEVPEELIIKDFKKKAWFFFHETYPLVIDTRRHDSYRFKRKEEDDFNFAVNPFKLQEF